LNALYKTNFLHLATELTASSSYRGISIPGSNYYSMGSGIENSHSSVTRIYSTTQPSSNVTILLD